MTPATSLQPLSQSKLALSDSRQDLNGRKVRDGSGEDLGTVDELLVDDEERRVRFIVVRAGGFLGIGDDRFFIPVDAVVAVTEDEVIINQTSEQVADAPRYEPDLMVDPAYLDQAYAYYGYAPYWTPGYANPAWPPYRR